MNHQVTVNAVKMASLGQATEGSLTEQGGTGAHSYQGATAPQDQRLLHGLP